MGQSNLKKQSVWSQETDSSLIDHAASGSQDAFTELVKRYQRQVLSTAYRYVGNASDAQDLAQEIFIKVWDKAGSFKQRSKFSTWLYRIVVNHCLNYQEKRKRRQTVELDECFTDNEPTAEERFDKKRRAQVLRKVMAELPERQRIALILSKFEQKSYAEIAGIMKISLSSVESLIFRAKNNLKKILVPMRDQGKI